MVPEYDEPYLASNSEVYSKIKLNNKFHPKRQDKQRIREPADFTSLPRLRSEVGKEQFRFSDENEHSSACQERQYRLPKIQEFQVDNQRSLRAKKTICK